jgi:hypothetical protein
MVSARLQIVLVPIVAIALSAAMCFYADRVTRNASTYPWHTPTALEQICYWLLAPGVLMAAVLPHQPADSFEDVPSVSLVALVVGVSIVCWGALVTSLYWITRYALRKARTKPTI